MATIKPGDSWQTAYKAAASGATSRARGELGVKTL